MTISDLSMWDDSETTFISETLDISKTGWHFGGDFAS
jgi:hypothetical protein